MQQSGKYKKGVKNSATDRGAQSAMSKAKKGFLLALVAVLVVGVAFYAMWSSRIEFENTEQPGLPTIVYLGADWCAYCKDLAPVMEKVRDDFESALNVQYYNVDYGKGRDLSKEHSSRGVPMLLFFDAQGNKLQTELYGMRSYDSIKQTLISLGWTEG